jgi:hypothetical protein
MFYFPAKVSNNYFQGIKKQDVIDVIEFLKDKGYFLFSDANKIFKSIYVKDLDIKCDRKFPRSEIDNIKEWNISLKGRFNGSDDDFHLFDSSKQGLGISTYKRETATITKPFLKFYDKSREIKKSQEFFLSLPEELQEELRWNLVYRFEFTMKDKTFFKKYGLTNRLEEVMEVLQEKWNEVGKAFLRHNFDVVLKKPKDLSKLRPMEKVLMLDALKLHEFGMTENEILRHYVDSQENRLQKQRMKVVFNRVIYHATVPNEMTKELLDSFNRVSRFDFEFGLTDKQRVIKTFSKFKK